MKRHPSCASHVPEVAKHAHSPAGPNAAYAAANSASGGRKASESMSRIPQLSMCLGTNRSSTARFERTASSPCPPTKKVSAQRRPIS